MDGTIIQQGSFTSTGATTTIKIRSDLDWMTTYNYSTIHAGPAATTATECRWFRGMAANNALVTTYTGAGTFLTNGSAIGLGVGGFTLVNTSTLTPSALTALQNSGGGSNAVQPVYLSNPTVSGLGNGAIVRLSSSTHTNLQGLDFSVDLVTANTSFRLANAIQQAPGANLVVGSYRMMAQSLEEYQRWYPSVRTIANITQAAAGVVTTLVDHGLTTGQTIRLSIPTVCGMTQLDQQVVTVTYVSASTFTIGVDTTGYTAFNFPTIAQFLLSPQHATMTPIGIAQSLNSSILTATDNKEYIGMKLAGGAQSPAGVNTNLIYWIAGKSFNM